MTGAEIVDRRGLPCAEDIERWVLGSVFVADSTNETFQSVAGMVGEDEFTSRKNRAVFSAMAEIEMRGLAIDRGSVYEILKDRGEVELVGGLGGLLDLDESMPQVSASTLNGWLVILREKSALRRIIRDCDAAIVRAVGCDSSEAIVAQLDKALTGISDKPEGDADWRTPLQIMGEYPGGWQGMIDPPKGGGFGLPLPWGQLSEDLCGLKPGELILVGARPSMGKSVFGMQAAYHVAKQGKPVAFFSLEMTGESLIKRLIAAEGRVNSHLMRHGHLSAEDKSKARAAVIAISDMPLYIDQRKQSTFTMRLAMKRLQRRLKADGKPSLSMVVVDHFHLLEPIHPREEIRERFNRSADDLMNLAKEFGIPVMALCQVGRKCEDEQREPVKSDLAESGKLEQNAHVIVFLHRPEVYPKYRERGDLAGMAWAIVAKQREGPIGQHPMVFQKQFQRFEEAA